MILAIIQSSAILLAGFAAAWVLRKQSAAIRHLILTVALLAALVVPFVGRILPEQHRTQAIYARVETQTVEIVSNLNAGVRPAAARVPPSLSPNIFSILFGIWMAGAALMVILMMAGMLRLACLARYSRPFESSLPFQSKRRVRLLQNQRAVLGTWGVLRPSILLPRDADQWPGERLRNVLTHELGHIFRFDWPVQMTAELARAFYWFNPLFWLLCRRLRAESEHACDDVVLNTGVDANDYAAHLLELARTLRNPVRTWTPVLAMARPLHLERRFVAMLNPSLNRKPASRAAVVVACVLALLVTLPFAAVHAGQTSRPAETVPVVTALAVAAAPTATVAPEAKAAAARKVAPRPKPAQGLADGSVSGTVVDASGARVPGVVVTVLSRTVTQNAITETEVQTTTTVQVGSYEFRGLAPGQYIVKAELPGFSTFRSAPLQVTSGQNIAENVMLSLGTVVQKVELIAAGQPRQPGPPPTRVRVGGNVQAARLISQVKPVYPQSAHDAGIEGVVHIQGMIGRDGTLVGLSATNSFLNADLTNAALDAVSQWRYSPALLNNEPIQVPTLIDVEFKLTQ